MGCGSEPEPSAADIMATASTSGQSGFGLGKKKKSPGLMDQLSKFFGGEKKKRSKVSFSCYFKNRAVVLYSSGGSG